MRAVAMRSRVLRRYDWAGASGTERALLDTCLTTALARREALLEDEEDPRFLHPARSVLILLDDADVRDAALLGGAALVETEDAALAVPAGDRLPDAALAWAAAVPQPRTLPRAALLEALVVAPQETRLVACAERLDQARHAHMLPDFDAPRWLAEVLEIWLPVAQRTHERIALRFERWAVAWQHRLERG